MDLYGNALSAAKLDDLRSYYNEDLSFSEIAVNKKKSRQAVFSAVRSAERILLRLERKLGFLDKAQAVRSDFEKIKGITKKLQGVLSDGESGKNLKYLEDILEIADKYTES